MKRLLSDNSSVSFQAGLVTWIFVFALLMTGCTLMIITGKFNYSTEAREVVSSARIALEDGDSVDQAWASAKEWSTNESHYFVIYGYGDDEEPLLRVGDAPQPVMDAARLNLSQWEKRWEVPTGGGNVSDNLGLPGTEFNVEHADQSWRVATDFVRGRDGERYEIGYANPDKYPWSRSAFSLFLSTITAGALALFPGLITAWTVNRSLRRVDDIGREMYDVSLASLDRRVDTPHGHDPVHRLAFAVNNMFHRLEVAHQQQRQFVADASHELRSPITGLLTQLEVAEEYPDQIDSEELRFHLLTETHRMSHLVEDLLMLSELESDQGAANRTQRQKLLRLGQAAEVIEGEVERLQQRHASLTIEIDYGTETQTSDDQGALACTEQRLQRVLHNLGSNAARHATGAVKCRIRQEPGCYEITVMDDGPGIDSVDRERVFDRFVRLDEARSTDKGGSGLGLAICREIAWRAGGDIRIVDSTEDGYGGVAIVVSLPIVPEQESTLAATV